MQILDPLEIFRRCLVYVQYAPSAETYLEPGQISLMELFLENTFRCLLFPQKALSYTFFVSRGNFHLIQTNLLFCFSTLRILT